MTYLKWKIKKTIEDSYKTKVLLIKQKSEKLKKEMKN